MATDPSRDGSHRLCRCENQPSDAVSPNDAVLLSSLSEHAGPVAERHLRADSALLDAKRALAIPQLRALAEVIGRWLDRAGGAEGLTQAASWC